MKDAHDIPPGLVNACTECGDCFHPVVGPNTDGEPCEWCQDCGCHADKHTRMTRVTLLERLHWLRLDS